MIAKVVFRFSDEIMPQSIKSDFAVLTCFDMR